MYPLRCLCVPQVKYHWVKMLLALASTVILGFRSHRDF
jgi:hypothetical protein